MRLRLRKVVLCVMIASFAVGMPDRSIHAASRSQAKSAKGKSSSVQGKSSGQGAASINAVLTDAPLVPPRITRSKPGKVIVELEVSEVNLPLSEGVEYTFRTFGGKVPGKFIRVRQGDTVEFHLMNHPDSKYPHNIDLHAVTGPGEELLAVTQHRGVGRNSRSRLSCPDCTSITVRQRRWVSTSRMQCMG